MEFLKKTELFFIQLQYCLTIEPEPILQAEKGYYRLMLKPDIFLKLINDFQIEYPFIPENKIIELKGLMSKENINTKDALKIIENYKKQYWFLDTVTMFKPVIDKLKRTHKKINVNATEMELNIELFNYQKHLQAKRESIYFDLINEIQSLPPQQTETKTEKLKAVLGQYGFFELPKVKRLSEPAKQSLIELIGKNDLPYSIAMLNFLDFLNHLEKEYFKTKYKLNIEVAKWFDSDKDGRRIKGNISVLSDYSNENKSKFTAHLHKETVKIDYQNLK